MTSVTLGRETYAVASTEDTRPTTQQQVNYIVLLAKQVGAKYGEPTTAQIEALEVLMYDQASRLIEALKAEVKQYSRERYTHLPNSIGSKTMIEGIVQYKTWVASDYGGSDMLTVIVDDKYRVTMFTNAKWASNTNIGDTVCLVGTVKKHREFRTGEWSTILSRPSLKPITHPSKEENK